MIRSLWTIITVMALANFVATLALGAWLVSSGRLDKERFNAIRATLGETVVAEQTRLEDETRQQEIEDARVQAEIDALIPPLTAADKLRNTAEAEEVDRQRIDRLTRDVRDLQRTIDRERQELDVRQEAFNREKAAFESMRSRIREIEGQDQFKKAVQNLQSQKTPKARDILQALIDQGNIDQAVAYLNAIGDRQAAKIIGAFEDPAVAADLLERLRTRGTEASAP